MNKVTSPEIITRIPDIIREVMYAVDTDMTFRELLGLAGAVKAAQENGLVTDMVPGYPLYIDEISYWIPDVEEIRYAMALGLGVSFDANLRSRTERVASEYSDSIPDNATEPPADAENIGHASSYRDTYRRYDDYYENDKRENFSDDRRVEFENDTRINSQIDNASTSPRSSTENADSTRREYPREYSRDDESIVPRRIYEDNNTSTDRTNSNSRAYESRTDDARVDNDSRTDNIRREITTDELFDVPSRNDSEKTRN